MSRKAGITPRATQRSAAPAADAVVDVDRTPRALNDTAPSAEAGDIVAPIERAAEENTDTGAPHAATVVADTVVVSPTDPANAGATAVTAPAGAQREAEGEDATAERAAEAPPSAADAIPPTPTIDPVSGEGDAAEGPATRAGTVYPDEPDAAPARTAGEMVAATSTGEAAPTTTGGSAGGDASGDPALATAASSERYLQSTDDLSRTSVALSSGTPLTPAPRFDVDLAGHGPATARALDAPAATEATVADLSFGPGEAQLVAPASDGAEPATAEDGVTVECRTKDGRTYHRTGRVWSGMWERAEVTGADFAVLAGDPWLQVRVVKPDGQD
jgi:hypothetical protein